MPVQITGQRFTINKYIKLNTNGVSYKFTQPVGQEKNFPTLLLSLYTAAFVQTMPQTFPTLNSSSYSSFIIRPSGLILYHLVSCEIKKKKVGKKKVLKILNLMI